MIENLFRPTHLILVLIIALVVFGPGKLPEVGSALGKSIRDFKKSMSEPMESAGKDVRENETVAATTEEKK